MPHRLTCDYRFEAAHRLPRVPPEHKCARLHGHSYQIAVVVEGPLDADLGWVVDFAEVDGRVRPLIEKLDHRTLNDVPGLENPTCEVLAQWLWQRIRPHLSQLREVQVAETQDSRCSYFE